MHVHGLEYVRKHQGTSITNNARYLQQKRFRLDLENLIRTFRYLVKRKVEWLVWGGLLLVVATLLMIFLLERVRARNTKAAPLPVLGQVSDFTLTNQNGGGVSLSNLHGQPWLADIIFTRCPGPCLKMSRQMKEIQEALPAASRVRLVSLSTDPQYDTPAILQAYNERFQFNAKPERWMFLTGTKEQIAKLAIDSLKLITMEKPVAERDSVNDLFIHSTIFVAVDKKGQLRAIFETTGEGIDFQQVKPRILETIRRLETER